MHIQYVCKHHTISYTLYTIFAISNTYKLYNIYTGIPDMRELQEGDIVNIDVSVYYNGYHADLNETYFVGISEHILYYIHVCILYTCMSLT